MKTLKINSNLHENLKSYASNNGVILQDLVETKLNEVIENNNSTFQIDDIQFFNKKQLFSILLSPNDLKTFISLLKKLCLNEKISNIEQMSNILDTIKMLENSYKNNFIDELKNTDNDIGDTNIDVMNIFDNSSKKFNNLMSKFVSNIKDENITPNIKPCEVKEKIDDNIDNIEGVKNNILDDEYLYSKFYFIKTPLDVEKEILNLAKKLNINVINSVLETSLYFNIYMYKNVKNVIICPKNKIGVIEILGFSQIDGRLIIRTFNSTVGNKETLEFLLNYKKDQYVYKDECLFSLKKMDFNMDRDLEQIPINYNLTDYKKDIPVDLKIHIDRNIFNKHILCGTELIKIKTNEKFVVEYLSTDEIFFTNNTKINIADLIEYKSNYLDENYVKNMLIEHCNNKIFRVSLYNSDLDDFNIMKNYIDKLIIEKRRNNYIKVSEKLFFIKKSIVDNKYETYTFCGDIFNLNNILKINALCY